MRNVFILFLLAVMLFTPAASHAQNDSEVWFQCQSDSDCVVTYACQDVAVNRNYVKPYMEGYVGCDKSRPSSQCDTPRPSDQCDKSRPMNPRAVAKCLNGKCAIVIPDQQK